jgi:hypothetical protein
MARNAEKVRKQGYFQKQLQFSSNTHKGANPSPPFFIATGQGSILAII